MIEGKAIRIEGRGTSFQSQSPHKEKGSAMEPTQTTQAAVQLGPQYVLWLSILATAGLVLMWTIFWLAAWKRGENVHDILSSAGFFRTVVVMGVKRVSGVRARPSSEGTIAGL